jgi:hypothetical protein
MGFEFVIAVSTNIPVFWDVTPCIMDDGYVCFGGNSCLHSQGRRVEYGGITFLQNVDTYLPYYMSSYPTIYYLHNPLLRYINTSI